MLRAPRVKEALDTVRGEGLDLHGLGAPAAWEGQTGSRSARRQLERAGGASAVPNRVEAEECEALIKRQARCDVPELEARHAARHTAPDIQSDACAPKAALYVQTGRRLVRSASSDSSARPRASHCTVGADPSGGI
jgi:hypothetical protein